MGVSLVLKARHLVSFCLSFLLALRGFDSHNARQQYIFNKVLFMSNLAIFNKTIQEPKTQAYLTSVLAESKRDFVTSLVSLVGNDTKLQACTPLTIIYAAVRAATLKLPVDPNLGFAYVIPYKNKGVDEAQFQLGAKGLYQLAIRSGQFTAVNVDCVYEGEISKLNRKSGAIELDGQRKSDKVIGYFAYFQLTNGFEKMLYMSKEEVEKHAKRFSKAYNYGPWKTDFDAMAKKTVLKALLSKYAPLSIEMQGAIKADQAVFRDETLTEDYVDNQEQEVQQNTAMQVDKIREKAEAMKQMAHQSAYGPEPTEPEEAENAGSEVPVDDMPNDEIFNN